MIANFLFAGKMPRDMISAMKPGEHLDLSSDPPPRGDESSAPRRRYVGIHFACCAVYRRLYVNRDETAYEGHCPKCHRPVRLQIGPGGTDQRIFTAF